MKTATNTMDVETLDRIDAAVEAFEEACARDPSVAVADYLPEAGDPQYAEIGAEAIAAGLAHAHRRGIVHSDVKPANILLADDGRPMILDFNLATSHRAADDTTVLVGGTLAYMAPEHLQAVRDGRPAEKRGDVFALGVILYEMLAGSRPFPARLAPFDEAVEQMIADRRDGGVPIEQLSPYANLESDAWQRRSAFRRLSPGQQQQMQRDTGTLLYLLADASARLAATSDDAERNRLQTQAVDLFARAAVAYPAGQTPRVVLLRHADALVAAGDNQTAAALRKSATAAPTGDADDYLQAVSHYVDAEYAAAAETLGDVCRRVSHDVAARFVLANAKAGMNLLSEAESDYSVCIALRPELQLAYFNRGLCRLELKRFDAAAADFTESLRLRPGLAATLINRALAHRGAGRTQAAIDDLTAALADFQQALALNPRSRSAQKNIAHVYSERLDRPQDAIAAPLPAIDYTIFGAVVSDSFGVDPDDPTGDPVHQCPDDPLMFCYPGGAPSPDPYLWDDFLDTLPEVPDLSGSELADLLLGDWWSWFWDQEPGNGPPLTLDDDYQTDQDTPLTVDPAAGVLGNDVEPEADPVSAILLDDVRFGTLALQLDGSFVYRPAPLFFGVDAPSPIQANRTSASTSLETTEPVVDQQFSNGQRPADLVRGPTALAPSHSKRAEGVFERSNDMAVRRAAYLLTNHRPVEFDDVLADVLASAGRTPRR